MVNNILDLPLDILILIFEQIQRVSDKKNFVTAHPKLRDVIYHSRRNVSTELILYNNREHMRNWDFLLEWWGPNLNRIDNVFRTVDSGNLIELAAKCCPNLETLKFEVRAEDVEKFQINLPKCQMLKELDVYYEEPPKHKIKDNGVNLNNTVFSILIILQELQNLRNLHLNFDCLQENERKQLNKLIKLEILEIYSIKIEHVLDLSNLFQNLRELQIKETDTVILSHIAQYCGKLEKLTLYDYKNLKDFPYFPKLTYIQLRTYRSCFIDFLCKLNNRYYDQLETLDMEYLTVGKPEMVHIKKLKALKTFICWDISSDCIAEIVELKLEKICSRNLTQNDNLRLVQGCSTLKELTFNYHNFDMNFLPKLLHYCKVKGFQPDRPFQLNICTLIQGKRSLMHQFETLPNSNLLSINYRKPW